MPDFLLRLRQFFSDKYLRIIIVASVVSILLISSTIGFTEGPDGNEYIATGFQLFQPEVYGKPTAYITPLYPVLLRLFFFFNNALVFKLFHHALWALLVPVIVYFSLKPFNRPAAFFTALLVCFDFNSMFHFSTVCIEGLYILALSLILFSFSWLYRNSQRLLNIYFHGLSIFFLFLIRAAGQYLFIFFLPIYAFYFRSRRLIMHFLMAFLVPLMIYSFFTAQLSTVKFSSSFVLLNFVGVNEWIDYDHNRSFQQLIDLIEDTFFQEKLPKEGKELLISRLEHSNVWATTILLHIIWSDNPKDFDRLMIGSVKEALKSASPSSLLKAVDRLLDGFYFFSKFHLLREIYKAFEPYVLYEDTSRMDVADRLRLQEQEYGAPVNPRYINFYYDKYTRMDISLLYKQPINQRLLSFVNALNCFFIILFTSHVYWLAWIIMFLNWKKNRDYFLIMVFGLLLLLYQYLLTSLFGLQERYRAPMDMFYFIAVGWLYSQFFVQNGWSLRRKVILAVYLVVCILLNIKYP